MDSAYKDILGCSKAEYEERMEEYKADAIKRMEEERLHALESMNEKIERGNNLIYPSRREDWAKLVEADANGMYHGLVTSDALEIMEAIEEEKSVEDQLVMFIDQNHSGYSASLTRNVVMTFSRNGYPFYKATHHGDWTEEECETILRIIQDNEDNNKDLSFENSIADVKRVVSARKNMISFSKARGQY